MYDLITDFCAMSLRDLIFHFLQSSCVRQNYHENCTPGTEDITYLPLSNGSDLPVNTGIVHLMMPMSSGSFIRKSWGNSRAIKLPLLLIMYKNVRLFLISWIRAWWIPFLKRAASIFSTTKKGTCSISVKVTIFAVVSFLIFPVTISR